MNVELSINHNRKGKNKVEIIAYQKKTRKRAYFNTGIFCGAEEWNSQKNIINGRTEDINAKNLIIQKHFQTISEIALKLFLQFNFVDLALLRSEFEKSFSKTDSKKIMNYIDYCITSGGLSNLADSSKRNYTKTKNRIEIFDKKANLADITPLWLNKFNQYLINEKQAHNTRWAHFKILKTVLKLAIRDGELAPERFPFGDGKFKITYKKGQKTVLTLEELAQIENTQVDERLETIKDMFLLCCYTGLRFSDVNKLCNNMIKTSGNESYIVLTATKTDMPNNIPLNSLFNGKPFEIVKKYQRINENRVDSYKWFGYANAYVNRELKTLQRWANISTVLTMHVARHSCCTFLVADFKLDPAIAQKILGHSSIKMTEQYLHVRGTHIEDSLKKIDWQ